MSYLINRLRKPKNGKKRKKKNTHMGLNPRKSYVILTPP